MDLYNSLKNYVTTSYLINDTILFTGGQQTWAILVSNSRLQAEAETELASVVSYWQGLVDAEPDPVATEVIWLRMERGLRNAFQGAERDQITEEQFFEILGIQPGGTTI